MGTSEPLLCSSAMLPILSIIEQKAVPVTCGYSDLILKAAQFSCVLDAFFDKCSIRNRDVDGRSVICRSIVCLSIVSSKRTNRKGLPYLTLPHLNSLCAHFCVDTLYTLPDGTITGSKRSQMRKLSNVP